VCFCDASEKAFSTVIYLHVSEENTTDVNVIFAKTRLAPIKKLTIPWLELQAVLIGLRCLKFVREQLRVPIEKQYLWTDSKCVLQWVTSDKKLPLFVKNRVSEIKEHIDVNMTCIPTKENPTDVASRGTTLETLATDSNWWHGSKWLLKPTSDWPTDYKKNDDSSQIFEMEKQTNKTIKRQC
jgi:hypothetical protein